MLLMHPSCGCIAMRVLIDGLETIQVAVHTTYTITNARPCPAYLALVRTGSWRYYWVIETAIYDNSIRVIDH